MDDFQFIIILMSYLCVVYLCGMIYTNNRQRTRQTIDARGVRNVIQPQDWSKHAGVEPKVQLLNLLYDS